MTADPSVFTDADEFLEAAKDEWRKPGKLAMENVLTARKLFPESQQYANAVDLLYGAKVVTPSSVLSYAEPICQHDWLDVRAIDGDGGKVVERICSRCGESSKGAGLRCSPPKYAEDRGGWPLRDDPQAVVDRYAKKVWLVAAGLAAYAALPVLVNLTARIWWAVFP